MTFGEIVAKINDAVYSVVGGVPIIVLLFAVGIFCTILSGAVQFRRLGKALKVPFEKSGKGKEAGATTPFQSLCTALASTVGTGNIAGVAGAIAIGGPGAIFWMWVSALLGMATKYAEVVISMNYREKNEKGEWVGGPMYAIKNGLGKGWRWLAYVFAACCVLASLGIGNLSQVNTIALTFSNAVTYFAPAAAEYTTWINLAVGILCAIFVGLVVVGGLKRLSAVTEKMIPLMSIIYIVGALVVIGLNYQNILPAFGMIFKGAFNPSAVVGGVVGMTIMTTLTKGVGRGIFSNEAGLGSAPIAHASSSADSPVKQGLHGVFEVFVDTIVICTLSALLILTSGIAINYGSGAGAELATAAITSKLGGAFANVFMPVAVSMFALSTVFGWSLYGARSIEFLFGAKYVKFYKIAFSLIVVVGAVTELELVWALSDTFNMMMAIPNLISVLALSGVIAKLTKDYFAKKKDIPEIPEEK